MRFAVYMMLVEADGGQKARFYIHVSCAHVIDVVTSKRKARGASHGSFLPSFQKAAIFKQPQPTSDDDQRCQRTAA